MPNSYNYEKSRNRYLNFQFKKWSIFQWKKDFLPNKDDFFSDLKVGTAFSSVIMKYPHFLGQYVGKNSWNF